MENNAVIVEEPAQEIVIIKKKRSAPKKRLIIVGDLDVVILEEPLPVSVSMATVPQKSIWLQMRRNPKTYPTIVWEGIENISDDEEDTPQAAGKRLSQLKTTRDRIQQEHFAIKVDELQYAGLFMNW
jgi:hypothetical protein